MIQRDPNLRTVVDPDGAAILDIPRNQITTLNSTGGFVWERLQQGQSIEAITQSLAFETNTDPIVVRHDVDLFLEQLQSRDLLRG